MQRKSLYLLSLLSLVAQQSLATQEGLYHDDHIHHARPNLEERNLNKLNAAVGPGVAAPVQPLTLAVSNAYHAGWGNITVGSGANQIIVSVDPTSPTTIIDGTGKVNGQNANYNPANAPGAYQDDAFVYAVGTNNVDGLYFNDNLCILTYCWRQHFAAGLYKTSSYAPFSGVLGLGLGDPKYGTNILKGLKTASSGKLSAQWSIATSGLQISDKTELKIGGYDKSLLLNSSAPLNYYPAMNGQWAAEIKAIKYNSTDLFMANETQFVKFDILSDSILFPNTTYNKLIQYISQIPGFTCNRTGFNGCIYQDVCGNLMGKMTPYIYFQFKADNLFYEVTRRDYIYDLPNSQECGIRFGRSTIQNMITLGKPFLNSFLTVYDVENSQIGIGELKNSFGFIVGN